MFRRMVRVNEPGRPSVHHSDEVGQIRLIKIQVCGDYPDGPFAKGFVQNNGTATSSRTGFVTKPQLVPECASNEPGFGRLHTAWSTLAVARHSGTPAAETGRQPERRSNIFPAYICAVHLSGCHSLRERPGDSSPGTRRRPAVKVLDLSSAEARELIRKEQAEVVFGRR